MPHTNDITAALAKPKEAADSHAQAPPELDTLAAIARAAVAGQLDTDGLSVVVDNDHAYAERCTGPVDGFGDHEKIVELWHGEGLADILVELLQALGVPARRP